MTEPKFIPALTGIRAISVYCIFLKHFEPFDKADSPLAFAFFDQFYLFLSFFFVLSGFVIYYKYHDVARSKNNGLKKYFVSRIARIIPILVILSAITFILGYKDGVYEKAEAVKLFLLHITLLKGFSSEYFLTGIGPSWSLSVEELFYIIAPFLFLVSSKKAALLKNFLLIFLAGIILTVIFNQYPFEGFFSSFKFTLSFTFFGRCFEFFCGISLAKFYIDNKKGIHELKARTFLFTGIIMLAIVLASLWQIALHYNTRHGIDTWQGIAVHNLVLPLAIVCIYAGLLYSHGPVQRFLSSRLMVALGNSTYSFYLLHTGFALSLIFKYVSTNFFISLACMIVIAYIFYRLVEQPLALLVKNTVKH